MRLVSRVKVLEGLSSGSILGLIRVVMLVCVREWGVPVRLITMGMMSTSVPCQCERNAFARGCVFYDKAVSDLKVTICSEFPFSYLNFTNREISASRGGVADEAGF
jgi:hypothetical protein